MCGAGGRSRICGICVSPTRGPCARKEHCCRCNHGRARSTGIFFVCFFQKSYFTPHRIIIRPFLPSFNHFLANIRETIHIIPHTQMLPTTAARARRIPEQVYMALICPSSTFDACTSKGISRAPTYASTADRLP